MGKARVGLRRRHARLAVNAAITWYELIPDTLTDRRALRRTASCDAGAMPERDQYPSSEPSASTATDGVTATTIDGSARAGHQPQGDPGKVARTSRRGRGA